VSLGREALLQFGCRVADGKEGFIQMNFSEIGPSPYDEFAQKQ